MIDLTLTTFYYYYCFVVRVESALKRLSNIPGINKNVKKSLKETILGAVSDLTNCFSELKSTLEDKITENEKLKDEVRKYRGEATEEENRSPAEGQLATSNDADKTSPDERQRIPTPIDNNQNLIMEMEHQITKKLKHEMQAMMNSFTKTLKEEIKEAVQKETKQQQGASTTQPSYPTKLHSPRSATPRKRKQHEIGGKQTTRSTKIHWMHQNQKGQKQVKGEEKENRR